MDNEYQFPIILNNGKRLALRHHTALWSGYSVLTINRLIESGEIATHLVNFQVYIDIDEALTVLSKSRFQPKRSAAAANKILSAEQRAKLFG